jgi:hypothetical protein
MCPHVPPVGPRELDVVSTVQNLARACPGFWASDELVRSCQAGDWLALDRQDVAQVGAVRLQAQSQPLLLRAALCWP